MAHHNFMAHHNSPVLNAISQSLAAAKPSILHLAHKIASHASISGAIVYKKMVPTNDPNQEICFLVKDLTKNFMVTIWLTEQDWYCDCNYAHGDCCHTLAVLLYIKYEAEKKSLQDLNALSVKGLFEEHASSPLSTTTSKGVILEYRFHANVERELCLLRYWHYEGASGRIDKNLKATSLILKQRYQNALGSAFNESDYQFEKKFQSTLSHPFYYICLKHYKSYEHLKRGAAASIFTWETLDQPITLSKEPYLRTLEVAIDAHYVKLKFTQPSVDVVFKNGFVKAGNILCILDIPLLTSEEKALLKQKDLTFSLQHMFQLLPHLSSLKEKFHTIDPYGLCISTLPEDFPKIHITIDYHDLTTSLLSPVMANTTFLIQARWPKDKTSVEILRTHISAKFLQESKLYTEFQFKMDKAYYISLEQIIFLHNAHASYLKLDYKMPVNFVPITGLAWNLEQDSQNLSLVLTPGATSQESSWSFSAETLSPLLEAPKDVLQFAMVEGHSLNIFQCDASVSQSFYKNAATFPYVFKTHLQGKAFKLQQMETFALALSNVDYTADVKKYENFLNALSPEVKALCLLPDTLQDVLRSYQKEGFYFLKQRQALGIGAVLADDMGLGKTLQALAIFEVSKKTLVICPAGLIYVWSEEIKKFRPELKVSTIFGIASLQQGEGTDVVITSYHTMRLYVDFFQKTEWHTIVLDEAQMIKNPDSQIAQACYTLHGHFKCALSGTPIENSPQDLWSIMRFSHPGYLGERQAFADLLSHSIKQKISPFILRRVKKDVLEELPPKIEKIIEIPLSQSERDVYQATKLSSLQKMKEDDSVMSILEVILKLRQICCDARLAVYDEQNLLPNPSSKTEALLEMLESALKNHHKCIVFSQWTSYLDLIGICLKERGFDYLRIDGSVKNRQEIVHMFQQDQGPPLMLLSLKAGGVGLTLTQADHVFIMDPWWNPSVMQQAMDRVHRIGQKNTVFVNMLITSDSLEGRILTLAARKKAMSDFIFEESSVAPTKEDLLDLLI